MSLDPVRRVDTARPTREGAGVNLHRGIETDTFIKKGGRFG